MSPSPGSEAGPCTCGQDQPDRPARAILRRLVPGAGRVLSGTMARQEAPGPEHHAIAAECVATIIMIMIMITRGLSMPKRIPTLADGGRYQDSLLIKATMPDLSIDDHAVRECVITEPHTHEEIPDLICAGGVHYSDHEERWVHDHEQVAGW